MRLALILVAVALVVGCGEDDEPTATPSASVADLKVSVEPGGKTATVTCDVEDDCPEVAALDPTVFEPTPGNVACTQQYGGPETATVKGTLDGKEIDAKFSRENGCEIARWDAAKALFEATG